MAMGAATLYALMTLGLGVGWGRGHTVIRPWAVAQLPPWQQERLAPVRAKLCGDYLMLQDQFAGGARPDLAPYCSPPEVQVSLHDVPPPGVAATAMVWYLGRIDAALDAGELDEAARFLGVLCHWLEDPGSPSAHAAFPVGIDEAMLRELLPPPADKARYHYLYGYGGIADRGDYTITGEPHRPRLLGATPAEAALHLVNGQRAIARRARGVLVPMLQSELYGDGSEADRLRGEQARANAELVADAIYTALCLADDRIDPAEAAALDGLPLTHLPAEPIRGKAEQPYAWTPFLLDQAFDPQRDLHPLVLVGRDTVAFGLGMGAGGQATFALAPAGVYRRLSAWIGLHPLAGDGAAVTFAALADEREIWRSEPVHAGDPAREVTLALPPAGWSRLTLRVDAGEGASGANLAVWGEPRLWRE